jgi:hypothetical protein
MKNFTLSVKNLIKRMDCAETHMGSIKHFQFRTSSSLIRGKISTFEKGKHFENRYYTQM